MASGLAPLSPRQLPVHAGWWAEHARMVAALIVVPFLVLSLYPAVGGFPFVSMVA